MDSQRRVTFNPVVEPAGEAGTSAEVTEIHCPLEDDDVDLIDDKTGGHGRRFARRKRRRILQKRDLLKISVTVILLLSVLIIVGFLIHLIVTHSKGCLVETGTENVC